MLIALVGVTGVGKSYYKDKIVETLNFKKIKIITTRAPRQGEKNNEDKIFVTKQELEQLVKQDKIAYQFDFLGVTYAYTKEALFTEKNTVFELHYSEIYDFKKVCPDLCAIYLLPKNLEVAKEKLKSRHLNQEVEKARLLEIDEHYKKITKNKELIKMFDYVLYNNYDNESEENVIKLVNEIIKNRGL